MRKLSPQRQAVLDLVAREGSITPQLLSSVTSMSAGAARKILYAMYSDGELESPQRGKYTLSDEQTLPDQDDVTEDVTGSVDVTPEVTEPEELPIEPPIPEGSPSGTWAFSVQDGGMISVETLRKRKGYLS